MLTIKAIIHHNRRDTESMYPKVLLTDIEGLDRDHCWVDAETFYKVIPTINKISHQIEFNCTTKEYFSLHTKGKVTVTNVSNIKLLSKIHKKRTLKKHH
jgi:hypothetical protein